MYIGNVEIKGKTVLAPMAGICNSAFRKIVKEMGCSLIYAEMVSDKAIFYGNQKTKEMLFMEQIERPIVQQIFGSDKESFVEAAKYIEKEMKPDIIDINMGCPVPKVAVKSQAGAALLKDPQKIYEIVSSVVKAVNVPVTVKIRSGWDQNNINAVSVAKICESAGASAICVHPRTRSQGYSGKADWNIIKQVKEAVKIPVIGNGDITDIYNLEKYHDELSLLEGFGPKMLENLYSSINESKNNSLERLLFALGIRQIGAKTAKILARKYKNIDSLMQATVEELTNINDIGSTIASSIVAYFKDKENIEIINKLKNYGVNMTYLDNKNISEDEFFLDKTFVLTGTLYEITRDKASQLIEDLGGKTSSSVSKKTNYVIAGENAGSKYDRAISLKIPIITEEEFMDKIKKYL